MTRLRYLVVLAVLALWAGVAAAQMEPPPTAAAPDYKLWDSVASRAETAIDDRTDDNATFESLRGRIAEFRATFSDARQTNSERIASLRAQIDALGPVPEEGGEPRDIADRRSELERQLKEALSPGQVADEAFRRADGLIRQIDKIIRERQARRLLELGPSPINPLLWAEALSEFATILSRVRLLPAPAEHIHLVRRAITFAPSGGMPLVALDR